MARGGAGALVGLEAATEIVGGELGFEPGEFFFEADAHLGGRADAFQRLRDSLGLADPVGGEFGADGLLKFRQAVAVQVEQGGGVDGHLAGARGGEDAVEGREVGLADRVELVVVAAGAGDREPEEGLADHVDLVVDVTHLFVDRVHGLVAVLDHAEMPGAEGGLVELFRGVEARGVQQVTGQLLTDELVVRDVRIEGSDEIVAVAPGLRDGRVAFAAVGIRVADQVHPMAGEVFAVARGGQQAIDDLGEGLRRGV